MKVKQYNEMMAYLTRPGFNGGGSVRNKTVLPKRKPAEEIKRKQKINYEKIKQYLGKESQEFIERELGFAIGGSVETPKRGLVDEPGSYSVKDTYAGRPTKLYSSLKDAVTPERYEQIKFANPEMSEKQLEKSYKKLTRSQKYDLISLQKGGVYKNKSGMINPTRSKIVKYSNRVITLRNFKIVEEAGTINPETKKPFTQEEFFKITPSKRTYYLKLASDPIGFREEQRAEKRKRVDEGKIKVSGYNNTPNALRGERNGLLRFLRTAAEEGNPNYELVKRKGEIIGVKDKKAGVVYRPAIFTKPYSEKNHVSIHEHPDYRKVHNPYYRTQGGRPGLFELAKEFKFTSPNTTLGTYFAKYGEVPSYSDMYNFLTRGPESRAFRKQFNALEKHHVSLIKGSPTKNIQLTLHDKNAQAEFLLRSYDDPNSPYYKDQKYMDRELKKINARLKVGNKILGGAPLTGEKALAAAKRETVRLFKKRLAENPNIADDLIKAVNALPKYKKIKICNSLAEGGLPGDCAKAIEKDPIKTSNTVIEETKNLPKAVGGKALQAARFIKNIAGPAAIAGEIGFEGLMIGDKALETGMPLKQAFGESILNLALGPKLRVDVEAERAKEFAKGEDFAMAERGRRKAPFLAQGEYADRLRREARVAEMQQKFPGVSEDVLKQELLKQDPNIDLSLFPIQDLKQLVDDQAKLDYFADNFRQEKAGGGIMKMAGKSSGPAPKSGPTPDGPSKGLEYLFKNDMKEEE